MDESGPSWTARRVAAHRLDFTRVPAPYGDAAADEALAGDVAGDLRITEGRMHEYLAARTAFFDRIVVGALDAGIRQVVIGGAGYDGRALRYAKPGVRWFEVDHPATQADKLERLDRLGLAAAHVRFVAADFAADPVTDRLLAAGLDASAPGLFLLEGVAVYLEPAVVDRVLDQFRQVAHPGSRLAISVSLSGEYDRGGRADFRASVAAMGEPARSGFAADEADGILARAGWLVTDGASNEAAGRHRRLRSAGLLTATAGPRTPPSTANRKPQTPRRSLQKSRSPASPVPPSADSLSLSALLSQALVAFIIECDNEAEHRIPHRTTDYGASAQGYGAWLVSMVMYENCLKFVGEEPITVAELERLARTGTNLDGMRRWSYITIDGTAKKIHKGRPGPDAVLRATPRGLQAREVWAPIAGLTEPRWRERFGADQVGRLKAALLAVVTQLDPGLPDCLPILGANLTSHAPDPALPPRPTPVDLQTLPMPALLSRVLLSFALDYERESALSLAVSANLLRILSEEGRRPRDLPGLTGISKEAVSWALGILIRARLAAEDPDPAASRGKIARLTPKGTAAKRAYRDLLGTTEERWRGRFGADPIAALRQPLEALAAAKDGRPPPLFGGLEPYPDGWRARVRPPAVLPYYPMVLHRGGYPDGS
ncbi:MAG: SAM-dependent methyltransferase [Streptosporangiaceae bacterium]